MSAPTRSAPRPDDSDVVQERHVLCVDDDPEFLKSVEFFLPERTNASAPPNMWYRFLFFSNPEDALATLSELVRDGGTVAMLISDQKMPTMKGTELLAEVQQISGGTVRVLLTGYAGIESAIHAINERLLDKYLTKPIEDQEGFAVSIVHLLQGFEMQRQVERQSEIIGELYQFSNLLNACEGFDDTLERIADFAARALRCEQAFVLVRDVQARQRSAHVGLPADIEGWLSLPLVSGPAEEIQAGPEIRTVRSPSDLVGEVWNVDEAIRQALRFPMLTVMLEAEGEVLGMIGTGGRPVGDPFDTQARRTLSFIANNASIALKKLRARDRLQEAYRVMRDDARKLAEANQRLRVLDQARAEFLSFISHELATPLSLMSGVEILDELPGASGQAPLIQGLRQGYEQLMEFVARGRTYFDWLSRVPTVSPVVTDMAAVVAAVIGDEPSPRRERITFDSAQTRHLARIPEEEARSIFRVLLDNAFKFSGPDPRIAIVLKTTGDRVILMVRDQGRGFPPGWATELVRPFAVADTLHHHRGSGLNLATAASIAQAFGGSLEAISAGWDKGATFTVRVLADCVPVLEARTRDAPPAVP